MPALTPFVTDATLQQSTARTNALISNNSWGYSTSDYNLAAASYDQAVRDSDPGATGSQPVIYVFAAGNNGGGDDGGQGGSPDSLLSPAVAKNVISVGASELPRNITNDVHVCDSCNTNNTGCTTNKPWQGDDGFAESGGAGFRRAAMWASASKAILAGSSRTWLLPEHLLFQLVR